MEAAELPSFFVFMLGPFTEEAQEQAAYMYFFSNKYKLIKGFILKYW